MNRISWSNLFGHNRPHTELPQIHDSGVRTLRQQTSRIILHLVIFMSCNRTVFSHQTNVSDIRVYSTRRGFTVVWSCKFNWSVQCMQSLWHSDLSSLCNVPQTKCELICQQEPNVLRPTQYIPSFLYWSAALRNYLIMFKNG